MRFLLIIVLCLMLSGCSVQQRLSVGQKSSSDTMSENQKKQDDIINNVKVLPAESNNLVVPISEFKERITKKSFGIYVSPENSPVYPERFRGYHTGVDVEYDDTSSDVPVYAIANGTILRSGFLNGYGGVVIIRHEIDGQIVTALYGHLRPSSLVAVNKEITKGELIGVLGTGYSKETDNERKHLHFSIHQGYDPALRGYVSTEGALQAWIDPLNIF